MRKTQPKNIKTEYAKARITLLRVVGDALASLHEGAMNRVDPKGHPLRHNTVFLQLQDMLKDTNPDAIRIYNDGVHRIATLARLGHKRRLIEVALRYSLKLADTYANFG